MVGTPLYTDVRRYGERGVPAVIYGAGPRTALESNAKRADERLVLEVLPRATKVVARTLFTCRESCRLHRQTSLASRTRPSASRPSPRHR